MPKSVKKNFAYNLLLTLSKYLFPLITYPYVSRVLGVSNIGICNFVDSLIDYFVLFSTLGVGSFGVREIARCKSNLERRNKTFSSLMAINFVGTIIAVVVLVLCTLYVPSLQVYRDFLWIGLVKLFFSLFLIEWLFEGLQEFKYITLRTIAVRFLYVVGVFVFIRSPDDAIIYYALTVGSVFVNALWNWNYSRKFRTFSLSQVSFRIFILPVLVFGYYRLLTYMYTTFNMVFLGFCSGDKDVGYFATATKMYSILMGVFTAFTNVMVPKVSELLSDGNFEKIQKIADDTFNILTIVSLPIIIACLFCADEIIFIIAGRGYEGAILPFKIVIFLLLIIGMEQIVIQQFLMASTSNKSIFIVSTVGAVIGILGNIVLTTRLGAVGSAMSWGLSELSVLVVGMYLVKKILGLTFDAKILLKNIGWALCYLPVPIVFSCYLEVPYGLRIAVEGLLMACIFALINLKFNKNELVVTELRKMMQKIHSGKSR